MTKLSPFIIRHFIFFSILLSCCLQFACDNDTCSLCTQNDSIVSSGTFFGFCGGYCKLDMEIDNAAVKVTASSWNDPGFPDSSMTGTITRNEWSSLLASIDLDSLYSLDDVIGCPDCADGGGEWVEIEDKNGIKRVTFEYHDTIPKIQDLIDQIRVIRERFHCELLPDHCP